MPCLHCCRRRDNSVPSKQCWTNLLGIYLFGLARIPHSWKAFRFGISLMFWDSLRYPNWLFVSIRRTQWRICHANVGYSPEEMTFAYLAYLHHFLQRLQTISVWSITISDKVRNRLVFISVFKKNNFKSLAIDPRWRVSELFALFLRLCYTLFAPICNKNQARICLSILTLQDNRGF